MSRYTLKELCEEECWGMMFHILDENGDQAVPDEEFYEGQARSVVDLLDERDRLAEENKKLREALELIANTGTDCPMAMSSEEFYPVALRTVMGQASRALLDEDGNE